jgi:hypothetical protein
VNATRRFADWCASKEIHELTQVQPFHVAAFVHDLQDELSPPFVKQHLAANSHALRLAGDRPCY